MFSAIRMAQDEEEIMFAALQQDQANMFAALQQDQANKRIAEEAKVEQKEEDERRGLEATPLRLSGVRKKQFQLLVLVILGVLLGSVGSFIWLEKLEFLPYLWERERRLHASMPASYVGGVEFKEDKAFGKTATGSNMSLGGAKKATPATKPRHIFFLKGRAGLGNRLITLGNLLHHLKKAPSVELAIDWTDMEWRGEFWNFFDLQGPTSPRLLRSTREALRFLEGSRPQTFPKQSERFSDLIVGHTDSGKASLCQYPRGNRASRTDGGKPASKNCTIVTRDFRAFFKAVEEDSLGDGAINHSLACFYFNFAPEGPHFEELFRTLVLTPLVRDYISRVHAAAGLHEHPYIGVHVRATDKKVSVEPLFKRVQAAASKSPKSKIFLATDNESVLERARGMWGERLVSLSHLVPKRGRNEGIHVQNDTVLAKHNLTKTELNMDVILDLVSLACSATLVASRRSSLAQVAYFLHNDMEALKRFSGLDCRKGRQEMKGKKKRKKERKTGSNERRKKVMKKKR